MLDVYVTEFETVFCIPQSAVGRGDNANSKAASETGHSAVWGNPRGAKIRICRRDTFPSDPALRKYGNTAPRFSRIGS